MLVQQLVNSTAATMVPQGVNNSNNLSDILFREKHGFNLNAQREVRILVLLIMALISAAGHCLALFIQLCQQIYKRDCIWLHYFMANVFHSGLLIGYVPMLFQLNYESERRLLYPEGSEACRFLKYMRLYSQTHANFALVILAVTSYLISRKGFNYPSSVFNCFAAFGGFYALSAVPSLLIFSLHKIFGIEDDMSCRPYIFQISPLSCGNQMSLKLMITFIYVLPLLLIIFCCAKIQLHVWSNSSRLYTNQKGTLSMSEYRYIKIAFIMCLAFVFISVPFLAQLIIFAYFPSVNLNPNITLMVEILSLSNICLNPYFYSVIQFDLTCIKVAMRKLRECYFGRSAVKQKNLDLNQKCYEMKNSDACETSFVKLIN